MIKKLSRKIWSAINSKGMGFVIALSFTIMMIIGMTFIGVFLYKSYGNATEEIVIVESKQVLNQIEINLNAYLRNMMRISDAIHYNIIKNNDITSKTFNDNLNLIYEINKDNLVSLACFTKDGLLLGSAPVSQEKVDVDVTKQEWFKNAVKKMENVHFSGSHVENIFENSNNRYYWVVSLSQGVELTRHGKIEEGILLVDMNFSSIKQLFSRINNSGMGYVYLMDSSGKIIYHPRQNLIFTGMLKETNEKARAHEDGVYKENFDGQSRMVVVKTVGYTGWRIVEVIPTETFYKGFNRTKVIAVIIIIIAILVMVLASQFVAVHIVKPLNLLENSLSGIEKSDNTNIYIGGTPEISHLGVTIRDMVGELKRLTDDIVREQEEKRKSELDALQSQINPHFLYNTLDSIMWMIEAEKYDDAIKMIDALGKLFRISLSKGKNIITIGEELSHAKSYLEIQKYRYKNKFTSYFEIEEGIEQFKTIKLIIQPLIENAIYYGMEYMDGDGEVHIKVYSKGKNLYIDVIDNGLGIPKDKLDKILSEPAPIRSKGSGIGIRNVHQRIRLYFGEDYGLEIYSEPDEGTIVRIHLPKTLQMSEKGGDENVQ